MYTYFLSGYEKSIKLTIFGFISNMGGLIGLCLGFSFVSAVEIIYWFVVRMATNVVRK